MRVSRLLLACLLLSTLGFADQLNIRVLDPQQRPVVGARVALYSPAADQPLRVLSTPSSGMATFDVSQGRYRVEVLAPGFRPLTLQAEVHTTAAMTANLSVAVQPETVVVTAAGTALAAEDSAAPVATLTAPGLELLQPLAAEEALRFLPGAVLNQGSSRGGQASLFVRGGESRYNKVIIDGVPVNDPGGFFDFAHVSMYETDRLEFVRGASSILYGSDAMTSVLQFWTAAGHTRMPELRFGAEGGNFATARGYASLAGAHDFFDYNLFAEHLDTEGEGPNDSYFNTSQGGNVGFALSPRVSLRLRARHSNSRAGVQNAWEFNGEKLLKPDSDEFARQNTFLASADLLIEAPARWQHRLRGFEYNIRRLNQDLVSDRGCDFLNFVFIDCPFSTESRFNRAGAEYQGEFTPRSWARTIFGYNFEAENGDTRDELSGFSTRGLRRNHALYAEELLVWPRLSLSGGLRWVNNESFGQDVVPRVAASFLAWRGAGWLTGTRLRASYSEGIKAPDFLQSFGSPAFLVLPNPDLKPEENRALEAGIRQDLGRDYSLSAVWYRNLFRNRIEFQFLGAPTFESQYVNINRAEAQGAELEFHARLGRGVAFRGAYVYTETEVLEAPLALFTEGQPLLRRPKHSGNFLLTYAGTRWGSSFGGTIVGRRPDSDFLGFGIDHAEGYARFDLGGWYALNSRATAYFYAENLFDADYNEIVGFPAKGIGVRAGMRFRLGGE